uniref:EGF like, fibronectin type III and laminin G domains n=1 Tax=Paramormyrops kingsleyae TaxID=1676925 RepID=A0A3B3T6L7_9TELE
MTAVPVRCYASLHLLLLKCPLLRLSPPSHVRLDTVNCTAIRVRWRSPRRHLGVITGYKVRPPRPPSLKPHLKHRVNLISVYKIYTCRSPSSPTQPRVSVMSDTELALSWRQGEAEGTLAKIYISFRPELDFEWIHIREPVISNSMVLKGLVPNTQYQFVVRAVNRHGVSLPSAVSELVRTFSAEEMPSGSHRQPHHTSSKITEATIDTDDSDRDVYIEEVSVSEKPLNNLHAFVLIANDSFTLYSLTIHPPLAPNSSGPTASFLPPTPMDTVHPWKGAIPRLSDLACEDTACPYDSFCIDDYDSGGSRCHCSLGRRGDTCSEGVTIQFPRFNGHSHMTFEPLKNSYQTFQITLEFKAEDEEGLLFYCGENERGRGDFASLVLVRRRLHYRFNCGTGVAQIASESPVSLGQWHTVTVYRDGLSGWLRLDNDTPVTGRSQGQYTKITFRTPFFVGGTPTVYWLAKVAGTSHGFRGCLQTLLVNGKVVDLRPWPLGDALSGADIGECSDGVCEEVTCANGGVCFANRADGYICLCPLGFRGPLCQESFLLALPWFNETLLSYASAPWPQSSRHYLSFMEFEITFRPSVAEGTLLYSEDQGSRDFLSIMLVGGYLEFRFDCGSGAAAIRSEEPVSLNMWHEVWVSRTARKGILQVDKQQPVEGVAEGPFTQIHCTTPLYVGGVPDYGATKRSAGILRPFSGSIQKVFLNDRVVPLTKGLASGVNVENAVHPCADQPCTNGGTCRPRHDAYVCQCLLGFEGSHCQRAFTKATEVPQFIGRSYLTYDNRDILKRVSGQRTSLFLRFRSTARDGLLLWRGDSATRFSSDFLSLGLQDGGLVFSYNLGSGVATVTVNGTFSDGQWHRVRAVRDGQSGKLTVDGMGTRTVRSPGKMRQLNVSGALYVGGMKEIALHTNRQFMRGLVGCISHLTLSTDYHLSLMEDAADGKNINTCGN